MLFILFIEGRRGGGRERGREGSEKEKKILVIRKEILFYVV